MLLEKKLLKAVINKIKNKKKESLIWYYGYCLIYLGVSYSSIADAVSSPPAGRQKRQANEAKNNLKKKEKKERRKTWRSENREKSLKVIK